MSDILTRYKSELLRMKLIEGPGPNNVPEKLINNVIEREKQEESNGIVSPVRVPTGYVADIDKEEFLYRRYDLETDSGFEFFFKLNEEELKLLGTRYKKMEVRIMSPREAELDRARREEIRASGEFGGFGWG